MRTLDDERIDGAIGRGTSWLLAQQSDEGFWCGELEADTTLESDYILYLRVLGRPDKIPKLAAYVRERQLADGGWNIYEGGPSELNATIKAYVGLKLAGDAVTEPHLARARDRILALGGVERANSFTRMYLALIGALPWTLVPAVPPELVLLPDWCPLSIFRMSSWTRAIVVPLTILSAMKPRFASGTDAAVPELFAGANGVPPPAPPQGARGAWRRVFLLLDRIARAYDRCPARPGRTRALRAAERWLVTHLERSDGLGAIYPAIMNAAFALMALGRSPDDPDLASQTAALEALEIEDDRTIRVQPCVSPVWDTAVAACALSRTGLPPDHPALTRAAGWLLDRQIITPGDWSRASDAQPGGWAFEFRNDFYPDIDDTAYVLLALHRIAHPDGARMRSAIRRGVDWLLGMQNDDGGWGAFDRNNDAWLLTNVPFADHNAMIDPSTVDVTARVLECLATCGISGTAIERGLAFIARRQEPNGSWFGRWGVNYIYGTAGVLRAAAALGVSHLPMCRRGADWLEWVQNPDGGFGETCASYDDPSLGGRGPSTPSQTAWALVGLISAGREESAAASRAREYLLTTQRADGAWTETATTGTGFPRVFYLKYHLYRQSFPIAALARCRRVAGLPVEAQPLHAVASSRRST